ncbi:RsiV family protein [Flavimobilis soli]|nr:RsiV family protein [Flavimobilis soli]
MSTATLGAVLAVGIALSGAIAAPAAAAPAPTAAGPVAAAKTAPSLTVTKKTTSTTTKPFPLTTTSRMPVLKGATAKNRALVTKNAKALLAAERSMVASWRESCGGSAPSSITVTNVSKAVYKKRYASVTMVFDSDAGCDGVTQQSARSFTLDLKTGKKVKLSKFMAPKAAATRAAIVTALHEQNPKCVDDQLTAYAGDPRSLPATPAGWTVSSKGVRVWFNRYEVAPGACGAVSALVPWRDVASSAQLKGKRTSRVYVSDLKKVGSIYTGSITVLSVQGKHVARLDGWLYSEAYCTLGVRTGKKVRGFLPGGGIRHNFTLAGTTKKPTLKLGKSWRLATSKELAAFKKGGVPVDAIKACA